MPINLIKKLGEGCYADVWAATDDLDRAVAVKVIRKSMAAFVDALAHAKALARVDHENVVRVIQLDRVIDPISNEECDCVVMELIKGETLRSLLRRTRLSRETARTIGEGLIAGIRTLHGAGLAHGDLHSENVMCGDGTVKVIDVLYLDTLAVLSTSSKEERLRRDIRALRVILQDVIRASDIDPAEATEFNAMLGADASLDDLQRAFGEVTSVRVASDDARQLEHAYKRFRDEGFSSDEEYANALAEVTPLHITFSLLRRIIDERLYDSKHRVYVRVLWQRLDNDEKQALVARIAELLDEDMPKGRWWPNLRLTSALGEAVWKLIPRLTQLRAERMIANDVLSGSIDIYRRMQDKGAMGTYAKTLWPNFSASGVQHLAENLLTLLNQDWYTQNYVAEHFIEHLPSIAERTGKREQMLEALDYAVRNDAKLIRAKLEKLGKDWVDELAKRESMRQAQQKTKRTPDDFDDDIPF